jgi:transcriptional regulator with XRE-family HTH domain
MTDREMLEYVQKAFDVSLSGLAQLLGSTRQTVHNLMRGKTVTPSHATAQRIAVAVEAADILVAAGVKPRRLTGRQLLALVKETGDLRGAATRLVFLLEEQAAERARMDACLSALLIEDDEDGDDDVC